MKTLKKIKLNHYADEELKEREMNLLRGGGDDDDKYCVCKTNDSVNANANIAGGYTTAGGEGDCFSISSFASRFIPFSSQCIALL